MKIGRALASGAVGAVGLTLLHQAAWHLLPHAPRMDVVGMRALEHALRAAGVEPPQGDRLYNLTLLGDLVGNTLFYSLVGLGGRGGAWPAGAALGAAAGLGAALLPDPLGLGPQPGQDTPTTQTLAFVWYFAAGLLAAATYERLAADEPAGAPVRAMPAGTIRA
ncbi:MAG TPA: hypothetical protein VFS21_39995 [Roseiflexaceae bacterium]|nr:hypothetical protein [Roseiflexaceae bacterium]